MSRLLLMALVALLTGCHAHRTAEVSAGYRQGDSLAAERTETIRATISEQISAGMSADSARIVATDAAARPIVLTLYGVGLQADGSRQQQSERLLGERLTVTRTEEDEVEEHIESEQGGFKVEWWMLLPLLAGCVFGIWVGRLLRKR